MGSAERGGRDELGSRKPALIRTRTAGRGPASPADRPRPQHVQLVNAAHRDFGSGSVWIEVPEIGRNGCRRGPSLSFLGPVATPQADDHPWFRSGPRRPSGFGLLLRLVIEDAALFAASESASSLGECFGVDELAGRTVGAVVVHAVVTVQANRVIRTDVEFAHCPPRERGRDPLDSGRGQGASEVNRGCPARNHARCAEVSERLTRSRPRPQSDSRTGCVAFEHGQEDQTSLVGRDQCEHGRMAAFVWVGCRGVGRQSRVALKTEPPPPLPGRRR